MDELRQILDALAALNDEPDWSDDDLDATTDRLADGERLATPDDGAERAALQARFRDLAAAQPAALGELLGTLQPGQDFMLQEAYEILAPAVTRWRDVYLGEFEKLLALLQRTDDPEADRERIWVQMACEGLIEPIDTDPRLWTAILERLRPLMQDQSSWQRRVGVWLLGLLAPRGDAPAISLLVPLKADADWRVRYLAHIHHNGLNDRPMKSGVPFFLGLRAIFDDPIRMT